MSLAVCRWLSAPQTAAAQPAERWQGVLTGPRPARPPFLPPLQFVLPACANMPGAVAIVYTRRLFANLLRNQGASDELLVAVLFALMPLFIVSAHPGSFTSHGHPLLAWRLWEERSPPHAVLQCVLGSTL